MALQCAIFWLSGCKEYLNLQYPRYKTTYELRMRWFCQSKINLAHAKDLSLLIFALTAISGEPSASLVLHLEIGDRYKEPVIQSLKNR